MATTIQVVAAGALLLAWIWVLGRPLVTGALGRNAYRGLERSPLEGPELERSRSERSRTALAVAGRIPARLAGWWRTPVEIRRRQLMLATIFAAFGSFLLAIALRGRFVYLFGAMICLLVVHIAVAARVGGTIVAARRAQLVAEAKSRVKAEGMQIRATRVGSLLEPGSEQAAGAETDGGTTGQRTVTVSADGILEDARPSAFRVASEIAAGMAAEPRRESEAVGVTSFVSDLIDLEWGRPPDPSETSAPAPSTERSDRADREPPSESREEASGGQLATEEGSSEPIFTRPTKDVRPRPRRKARPVSIESQLDEEGGLPRAKAVNHP